MLSPSPSLSCIEYSPYSLYPKYALNALRPHALARQGALLKFCFLDGSVGFADCHPWEELEDAPLKLQLKYLSQGTLTSLTKRSLYFAEWDRQLRVDKVRINLPELQIKNHIMVSLNEATIKTFEKYGAAGFDTFKLKCGFNIQDELEKITYLMPFLVENGFKLRLDFNCTLSWDDVFLLAQTAKKISPAIDFFEDPFPVQGKNAGEINKQEKFNLQSKNALNALKQSGVQVAKDRQLSGEFGKILEDSNVYSCAIIKPAIQEAEALLPRVIFTSYMDHPVGQVCGLLEAAKYYKNKRAQGINTEQGKCGFLSHIMYDQNPYSELFSISNTELCLNTDGDGMGFLTLLTKEQWRKLNDL